MNVTVSLKHSNQRYTLCGYLQKDLNYHWKNYLYLHMEYNNDRYKNLHYSSAVNLVLFNKNQLNASVSYFCIIFIYTLFNNYNNHNNEKKTAIYFNYYYFFLFNVVLEIRFFATTLSAIQIIVLHHKLSSKLIFF